MVKIKGSNLGTHGGKFTYLLYFAEYPQNAMDFEAFKNIKIQNSLGEKNF